MYLLRNKNEAEENLKNWIKEINTRHEVKAKNIRLNNGREFSSESFKYYCKTRGIKLQYTNTYVP